MRKVGVSMFYLSSKYYDVIYSFKDYEQEARRSGNILKDRVRITGLYSTLLVEPRNTPFLKATLYDRWYRFKSGIRLDREVEKSGWSLFGCRHDPFSLGPEI